MTVSVTVVSNSTVSSALADDSDASAVVIADAFADARASVTVTTAALTKRRHSAASRTALVTLVPPPSRDSFASLPHLQSLPHLHAEVAGADASGSDGDPDATLGSLVSRLV